VLSVPYKIKKIRILTCGSSVGSFGSSAEAGAAEAGVNPLHVFWSWCWFQFGQHGIPDEHLHFFLLGRP